MAGAWIARVALPFAALLSATGAHGAVLDFSGSFSGSAVVGPSSTCAPAPFQGAITGAVGTSSLGAFTYSHSVCLAGGAGPVNGSFILDFGDNELVGTLAGLATLSGTPGVFDQVFNYTITGGTGQFANASGSLTGIGTVDVRSPPPRVSFNLDGDIIGAVPEPGTWLLMLLGFGAIGFSIRRRRRPYLTQAA